MKTILSKSIKLTLILFTFNLFVDVILLFVENYFFHSFYFSIIILAISIAIIVIFLNYYEENHNKQFKTYFYIIFFSLIINKFFTVAESICIYKYIDPEYKNRVVSIKINRKLEKIEEVEKNKNIDIEDYSEKELETERQKILSSFETSNLLWGFPKSIPFAFFLSLIISGIYSKFRLERIGSK